MGMQAHLMARGDQGGKEAAPTGASPLGAQAQAQAGAAGLCASGQRAKQRRQVGEGAREPIVDVKLGPDGPNPQPGRRAQCSTSTV